MQNVQQNIIAGLSPDYKGRPKVQRGGLQSRAEQREVWTEWLPIYKIQIQIHKYKYKYKYAHTNTNTNTGGAPKSNFEL